jgi:hypothetical protein
MRKPLSGMSLIPMFAFTGRSNKNSAQMAAVARSICSQKAARCLADNGIIGAIVNFVFARLRL